MADKISIRGVRVHNLKNIDVEIPRDKLVILTGLSEARSNARNLRARAKQSAAGQT